MELINTIQRKRFSSWSGKTKMYKQIGSMLRANKQIQVIFSYMIDRIENKNDPLLKMSPGYAFLKNGLDVIGRGNNLSDCFEGWVSPTEIVILRTGEDTGRYEEAFDQCIKLSTDIANIRSGIKSAMIMPTVAFTLALVILISARQKMIPLLSELVPMEQWKSLSMDFYALTESVGGNPALTVGTVVGVLFGFSWAIPNFQIKQALVVRRFLDRFPPFSYYKQIQVSIFLRSLATLIESNVRLKDAAQLLYANSNNYLRPHMEMFLDKVNGAKDESSIFKSEFLGEIGEDLGIMAQGDNLEGALKESASETMEAAITVLPSRIMLVAKLMIALVVCIIIFGLLAFQDVISVLQSG